MALNTAALDTRIKATVATTMYDMARVNANGYFDSEDSEEKRFEKKSALNALRTAEYAKGEYSRGGGCVELPVPEDTPFYVKDYSEYYKGRAYHERSLNSNEGWNFIGYVPEKAVSGLQGWVDCFEKAGLAGSLFCGGISDSGQAAEKGDELSEAYNFGKALR